jgi:predicted ATPase/DNA-binding winged helix-turn-helix (wHTH) protein
MDRTAEEWSTGGQEVISFGQFQFVPRERRLTKQGEPVKLGGRALDILHVLLENEGEVVGHKEIMARVWQGIFVEEVSLRVHMAALRKALDTGERGPRYLTNVPGRGYSFAAKTSRRSLENVASLAPLYPLPAALPHMVGRDEDIRLLCEKIPTERLVTLAGPGGIGKTTIALAVGRALLSIFDGAVCFVDLSRISDPSLVAGTVAVAFGLPVNPSSPIPSLVSHFRGRRTLLILDNCEHLVLEVASFTEEFLSQAKGLHILATSREILRAAEESVYRLGALDCPPANARLSAAEIVAFPSAKLFVNRLVQSGATIAVDDSNAAIIGSICRKLGGIALAIELAAGNASALGLKEAASLLDSQFALRWPGRRTAPPRHQTMSATLDWSYNLLSESERKVLRRLAMFSGSFTVDDACGVGSDAEVSSREVYDSIYGLVSKSLVNRDERDSGRHWLLETTRAYAILKLENAGEEGIFRRKYAQYFRDRLLEWHATRDDPNVARQTPSIVIDNIRDALRWAFGPDGDMALAVDLAAYSAAVWQGEGLFAECVGWMTRARAALGQANLQSTEQQLLIHTAAFFSMTWATGFPDSVQEEWIAALQLSTRKDVRWLILSSLCLWLFVMRQALYEDALVRAQRLVEIAKQTSDPGVSALANWTLGQTEHYMGRLGEARITLKRALDEDTEQSRRDLIRDTGWDRRSNCMAVAANVLWLQGFPDQARDWGSRAVDEARELGLATPLNTTMTWACLNKFLSDPDIDAVESDVVEFLEHARTHATPGFEGLALCLLGLCQTKRNDFDAAERLVAKGLELLAGAGFGMFPIIFRTHMCAAAIKANQVGYVRAVLTTIEAEDRNPEDWYKSEILRVKGLFELAGENREAAEALFLQSIDVAQKQGALSWELRTAMDLARLRVSCGQTREAIDDLSRIYARFTEGYETRDLVSARCLINDCTAATQ